MGTNEWYTPAIYIEAARQVMGSIDVDPASCPAANQRVNAGRYYTKEENGLTQKWEGNVWCNPPFSQEKPGQSSIKPWVMKAIHCYKQRCVTAVILLLPADTSTHWFEALWSYPICFPARRIQFDVVGKTKSNPTFGTCFIYLGAHDAKFIEVFSRFGRIVRALDEPKSKLTQSSLFSELVS